MKTGRTLRGLAVDRYGSTAELSRVLGWSYSRTNRIVNGAQEPTASEMRELVKALELEDTDDIVSVFSLA